jgi:hypothetical protein
MRQQQVDASAFNEAQVDVLASRDSVYAVCLFVCRNDGSVVVDPISTPWVDSPSSFLKPWPDNNVKSLINETSHVLADIARIKPKPFTNPLNLFSVRNCDD